MKTNFLKTLGFISILSAYWIMGVATSQEDPYLDIDLQLEVAQVDSFLVVTNNDSNNYNFDFFGIYYAMDTLNNPSLSYNLSDYFLEAGITDSILLSDFTTADSMAFPIDSTVYIFQAQATIDSDTGGSFYKEF